LCTSIFNELKISHGRSPTIIAAAVKLEELRMELEAELGHANFIAAYR
jgi:recombinational DNA repair protein RecT